MSSMSRAVIVFHEGALESSLSVNGLAVCMGVNKDTTSKDTMVSSGLILRYLICVRKVLTLSMEWGELFVRG